MHTSKRLLWILVLLLTAALPWLTIDVAAHTARLFERVEWADQQGFDIIGATTVRHSYDGSGVAVAVVDTGIDVAHEAFGASATPFNDKVIGGYDFVEDDADPRPDYTSAGNFHGTFVAGVIAGNEVVGDGYLGGVAPNAKLYSIRSSASKLKEMWQWVLDHQWDDPDNPIVALNYSQIVNTEGAAFTSNTQPYGPDAACETFDWGAAQPYFDELNTLLEALEQAGIVVVAASGNDGYCGSLPFPACHSKALTVGSIFDANLGVRQFGALTTTGRSYCAYEDVTQLPSCGVYNGRTCRVFEDSGIAGEVLTMSNAGTQLNLLAPSNTTLSTDFTGSAGMNGGDYVDLPGQTSVATAYVSGAVAVIQSAARQELGRLLSASQVKSILADTGLSTLDQRAGANGAEYPLVQLDKAIEAVQGLARAQSSLVPLFYLLLLE